jgi:hypothetical protein
MFRVLSFHVPDPILHKWSPQQTSVTTIPISHTTQHVAAVSMVSQNMPPSDGDDTRHWWQIDRATPVGGLGMAFAALQGASSDIHHAQQLSACRYPQSDVWGDPTFLDYIRFNRYPDDMSQEKRRHMRKRASMYSWFGDKVHHTMVDGSQREVPPPDARRGIITETMRRRAMLGYSEPPTGSISSTSGKATEPM